jgi:hypothetical protein
MSSDKDIIFELASKNIKLINARLEGCQLFLSKSTGLVELRGPLVDPLVKTSPTEPLKCLLLSDVAFVKRVLLKDLSKEEDLVIEFKDSKLHYNKKSYEFENVDTGSNYSIFNKMANKIINISGTHIIQSGQRKYYVSSSDIKNLVYFDDTELFKMVTAEDGEDRFVSCEYQPCESSTSNFVMNPIGVDTEINYLGQICIIIGSNVFTFTNQDIKTSDTNYIIVRTSETYNEYRVVLFADEQYEDTLKPIFNEYTVNRYGKVTKFELETKITKDQEIDFRGNKLTNSEDFDWLALYSSNNGDIYAFTINGYYPIYQSVEETPAELIGEIPNIAFIKFAV